MSLQLRLVLTAAGVAVLLWLALSLGYRSVSGQHLDRLITTTAHLAVAEAGACAPGQRFSHPLTLSPGRQLPIAVLALDEAGATEGPDAVPAALLQSAREAGVAGDRIGVGRRGRQRLLINTEQGACDWLVATAPRRGPPMAPLPVLIWPVVVAVVAALIGLGPPVRRAKKLAEEVRRWQQDPDATIPADPTNDEIGALSRAFHTTAAALVSRERALREFVENTTHDLATPLTVLQGHLNTLLRRPDPDAARSALQEARFLTGLLGNLTLTARLDAGEPLDAAVDLGAIVSRVRDRYRALAATDGIDLEAVWPDAPVTVRGDPTCIEQAINNLVENAIRYNHDGGHVAVILSATAEGFSLQVLDDGAGLTEAQCAEVLARGIRGDDARSRSPAGRGLGLSIVGRVAGLYGWRFSLQPAEEGGLRAALEGGTS